MPYAIDIPALSSSPMTIRSLSARHVAIILADAMYCSMVGVTCTASVFGNIYAPCLRIEGMTSCVIQRLKAFASGLREPRTKV